jgi:hydroxyacylglutathione hydrolase
VAELEICQIPVLKDNYVYLVRESDSGVVAVVDPAEADPVLREADRRGWRITYILNTHHHPDHVGGNRAIKQSTNCIVVGPAVSSERIPEIDIRLNGGDNFALGNAQAKVIFVPGHTSDHIAYWFSGARALFCGDTLFSIGCGRLFEGTAAQMWESLLRLRELPGDTAVYCAHEYTQANIRFALSIDRHNEALIRRAAEVAAARQRWKPTVPSRLSDEILANPFLRADKADLQIALGRSGRQASEIFAEIRRRKDSFPGT